MTRWLLPLVVASTAHADPPDVLAPLQDPSVVWRYEVVKGTSAASLAPVADAPEAYCRIKEVIKVGATTRAELACTSDAKPTNPHDMSIGGMLGMALYQLHYAVFDDDGTRGVFYTVGDATSIADKTNAGTLTFPRVLHGTWKRDLKSTVAATAGARSLVTVAEMAIKVLGKSQKVWVSETKYWDPPDHGKLGKPLHTLAALLPGVGPALLCEEDVDTPNLFWCLRLRSIDKK